jgi:hypothetical protein
MKVLFVVPRFLEGLFQLVDFLFGATGNGCGQLENGVRGETINQFREDPAMSTFGQMRPIFVTSVVTHAARYAMCPLLNNDPSAPSKIRDG